MNRLLGMRETHQICDMLGVVAALEVLVGADFDSSPARLNEYLVSANVSIDAQFAESGSDTESSGKMERIQAVRQIEAAARRLLDCCATYRIRHEVGGAA